VWIKMSTREPERIGKAVLLKFPSGIICSGRKRYGVLGEPSQDTYAYRCDCCGRFSTPKEWMPLTDIK